MSHSHPRSKRRPPKEAFARRSRRIRFEYLEDRIHLSADLGQVTAGLAGSGLFTTLQNALDAQAYSKDVPIVGTELGDPNRAGTQFLAGIQSLAGNFTLPSLPAPSVSSVLAELQTVFAADLAAGAKITDSISSLGNDSQSTVEFTLPLSGTVTTLVDFTPTVTPGSVLQPRTNLTNALKVVETWSVKLAFGVTDQNGPTSSGGFFFDTGSSAVNLGVNATLLPTPGITPPAFVSHGVMGLLPATFTDNGTNFHGTYATTLGASASSNSLVFSPNFATGITTATTLTGNSTVNLEVNAGLVPHGLANATNNLFDFTVTTDATVTASYAAAPTNTSYFQRPTETLNLAGAQLDLGSFFDDFIEPIFGTIANALEPIKPVIDFLDTPLPVISQVEGHSVYILDLLGDVDPRYRTEFDAAQDVITLLGYFVDDFGIPPQGSIDLADREDALGSATASILGTISNATGIVTDADQQDYLDQTNGYTKSFRSDYGADIDFPILDDPSQVFDLLLGSSDVTFFQANLSASFNFSTNFQIPLDIPVFPFVALDFVASIGADFNLGFGFDSNGLVPFLQSLNFSSDGALDNSVGAGAEFLRNSFFFVDYQHDTDPDNAGKHNIDLNAEVSANVVLTTGDIIPFIQFDLGGGAYVKGEVDFDFNELPENVSEYLAGQPAQYYDDKVRLSTLDAEAEYNPFSVFDMSGDIQAGLDVTVSLKVGIEPFEFTIFSQTFNLFHITLFSFNVSAPASEDYEILYDMTNAVSPVDSTLGYVDSNDILHLYVGASANQRTVSDPEFASELQGTNERVEISDAGDTPTTSSGTENVKVSMFSFYTQTFTGVKGIVYDHSASGGDDQLLIDPNVTAPVTIKGGSGSEEFTDEGTGPATIYGGVSSKPGSANTNITLAGGAPGVNLGTTPNFIYAGNGDDEISTGTGYTTVYAYNPADGTGGNDTITAGTGGSIIYGGPGTDTIVGGDDTANTFGDLLYAGSGTSTITPGTGPGEVLIATPGSGPTTFVYQAGEATDAASPPSYVGDGSNTTLQIDGTSGEDNLTLSEAPNGSVEIDDTTGPVTAPTFTAAPVLARGISAIEINTGDGADQINLEDAYDLPGVTSIDVDLTYVSEGQARIITISPDGTPQLIDGSETEAQSVGLVADQYDGATRNVTLDAYSNQTGRAEPTTINLENDQLFEDESSLSPGFQYVGFNQVNIDGGPAVDTIDLTGITNQVLNKAPIPAGLGLIVGSGGTGYTTVKVDGDEWGLVAGPGGDDFIVGPGSGEAASDGDYILGGPENDRFDLTVANSFVYPGGGVDNVTLEAGSTNDDVDDTITGTLSNAIDLFFIPFYFPLASAYEFTVTDHGTGNNIVGGYDDNTAVLGMNDTFDAQNLLTTFPAGINSVKTAIGGEDDVVLGERTNIVDSTNGGSNSISLVGGYLPDYADSQYDIVPTNIVIVGGQGNSNTYTFLPTPDGLTSVISDNFIELDDAGLTNVPATYTIAGTTVNGQAAASLTVVRSGLTTSFAIPDFKDVILDTSSSTNTIDVQGLPGSLDLTDGINSIDTIHVGLYHKLAMAAGAGLMISGNGRTTLDIDDASSTTGHAATVTPTSVYGLDLAGPLAYAGLSALNITGGTASTAYTITGTASGTSTSVAGSGGSNSFTVSGALGGPLSLTGGPGTSNSVDLITAGIPGSAATFVPTITQIQSVVIDNGQDSQAVSWVVEQGKVTANGQAAYTDSSAPSAITINAGSAANTFLVDDNRVGTINAQVTIHAGTGKVAISAGTLSHLLFDAALASVTASGKAGDSITLDDSADTLVDAPITLGQAGGSWTTVNGSNSSQVLSLGSGFNNFDVLLGSVTRTLTILGASGPSGVTVTGSGGDTITIGGTVAGPIGVTVGTSAKSTVTIEGTPEGPISVSGGKAGSTLTLDATPSTAKANVAISAGLVSGEFAASVAVPAAFTNLVVKASAGTDTLTVSSTPSGSLTVVSGTGNDTIELNPTLGQVSSFAGPVFIDNGDGLLTTDLNISGPGVLANPVSVVGNYGVNTFNLAVQGAPSGYSSFPAVQLAQVETVNVTNPGGKESDWRWDDGSLQATNGSAYVTFVQAQTGYSTVNFDIADGVNDANAFNLVSDAGPTSATISSQALTFKPAAPGTLLETASANAPLPSEAITPGQFAISANGLYAYAVGLTTGGIGELIVYDRAANGSLSPVQVISQGGSLAGATIEELGDPDGVAVDPGGAYLYTTSASPSTDDGHITMWAINPNNGHVKDVSDDLSGDYAEPDAPYAYRTLKAVEGAIYSQGYLYVPESFYNFIFALKPNTATGSFDIVTITDSQYQVYGLMTPLEAIYYPGGRDSSGNPDFNNTAIAPDAADDISWMAVAVSNVFPNNKDVELSPTGPDPADPGYGGYAYVKDPTAIALSPDIGGDHFVYVASGTGNAIDIFSTDADSNGNYGTLPGEGQVVNGQGGVTGLVDPVDLTVTASFVYVVTEGGSVLSFARNPTTGALTQITTPPGNGSTTGLSGPTSIVAYGDPTDQEVYITNGGTSPGIIGYNVSGTLGNVVTYANDPDVALTAIAGFSDVAVAGVATNRTLTVVGGGNDLITIQATGTGSTLDVIESGTSGPNMVDALTTGTDSILSVSDGNGGDTTNIDSTGSGSQTTLLGGTGNDVFNVNGLALAGTVMIDGGNPTTAPGDQLNFNSGGQATTPSTATILSEMMNNNALITVSVGSNSPVTFDYIETYNKQSDPTAGLVIAPINEGQSVLLNASTSKATKAGATIVSYGYDLNGSGVYTEEVATNPVLQLTWAQLEALGINTYGTYTIGLQVTDSNGLTARTTATLTVMKVNPTLVVKGATTSTVGATYSLTLSATDPGAVTIGSFVVNWGDGQSQTFAYNDLTPVVATHIYTVAGSDPITVTATDPTATYGPVAGPTVVVSVSNPVVSISATGEDASGNVPVGGFIPSGQTSPVPLVLTADVTSNNGPLTYAWDFHDAGTFADASTQTVSLNWSQIVALGDGAPGTYTLAVKVTDQYGQSTVADFSLTVVPDTFPVSISGPSTAAALQPYTLTLDGEQGQPDNPIVEWVVNWGDGKVDQFSGDPTTATHTYMAAGPETISAYAVEDLDTGAADISAGTLAVAVSPAPTLSAQATGNPSVAQGATYVLNLAASGPGSSQVTKWVVNWGDGQTVTYPGDPTFVSHVYTQAPAVDSIQATVDTSNTADPSASASPLQVTVTPVAPTVTVQAPASTIEGQTYTIQFAATTPAGGYIPSGWTVTWGDGIVDRLPGSATSDSHVYESATAAGKTDPVVVTASDSFGTQSVTNTVSVAHPAPRLLIGGTGQALGGQTYTLILQGTEIGTETLQSWTIHWGDGQVQTVPGSTDSVTHTYPNDWGLNSNGTYGPNGSQEVPYSITATATDALGTYNATALNLSPAVDLAYYGLAQGGDEHLFFLTADPAEANLTWQQAEDQAEADGGHLVEIDSAAEQAFLEEDIIQPDPYDTGVLWLGLRSIGDDSPFSWSDGDPFTSASYSDFAGYYIDPQSDPNPVFVALSRYNGNAWFDTDDGSATAAGLVEVDGLSALTLPGVTSGSSLSIEDQDVPPSLTATDTGNATVGGLVGLTIDNPTGVQPGAVGSYGIDWGDGTYSVESAPGTYYHPYNLIGTYYPSVNAFPVQGNDLPGYTSAPTLTISSVPPSDAISGPTTVLVGSVYTLTVAPPTTHGDYPIRSYVINWGDGTSSAETAPGNVNHIYTTAGDPLIQLSLTDANGTYTDVASLPLTVAAPVPTLAISGASQTSEGSTYTLTLGGLSDGEAVGLYTVNWGDGTSSTASSAGGLTHVYPTGPFQPTITVSVSTTGGALLTDVASLPVAVADVAPTIPTIATQNAVAGQLFSLTAPFIDPGTETWTASVNYGDGTGNLTAAVDDTGRTFSLSHDFTAPGQYSVTVSVTDHLGNLVGTQTFTVNVTGTQASVNAVSVGWGTSGSASLVTAADGLRLLPVGRNNDLPWANLRTITITLSQAETLMPGDVSVTGITVANYGVASISGSGTTWTITLAQPISLADRVTLTIANGSIATYTRRLDVLPGDVGDYGVVNSQDLVYERDLYLDVPIPGLPEFNSTFGDILGDGTVDVNDYNAVRARANTKLPPLP